MNDGILVKIVFALLAIGALPAAAEDMSEHSGHAMPMEDSAEQHSGHDMSEHSGHSMPMGDDGVTHEGHDMSQHSGHDMSAHGGHDMSGAMHHGHGAGGWMLEYRYMNMSMDGMQSGSKALSTDEALTWGDNGGYMMVPTSMTMDMHMLMAMYGITDRLMFMAMGNYVANSMKMAEASGCANSPMESSGLGDTVLGVMYQATSKFTFNANLSVPTGSIDERGSMNMDMMDGTGCKVVPARLPYAMQLGSGTFDLAPSVAYKDRMDRLGWGIDAEIVYRLGENANEYALGDRFRLNFNGSLVVNSVITGTGRLAYVDWQAINGQDPNIDPQMAMIGGMTMGSSPTNDPNNYGGTRLDFLIGINADLGKGHGLSVEIGIPVLQDLDGLQMSTDRVFSLGYHYMMM